MATISIVNLQQMFFYFPQFDQREFASSEPIERTSNLIS